MPKGKYIKTEQHKKNLSISLKGRKGRKFTHTKEAKLKMSKAKQGKNHPMYGVHKYGKNAPNWKGGKTINNNGYVFISKPEHPYANSNGYVAEHRLIIEKLLGRYLKPKEKVHHINRKRDDNRNENFELFPSSFSHLIYHQKLKEITTA